MKLRPARRTAIRLVMGVALVTAIALGLSACSLSGAAPTPTPTTEPTIAATTMAPKHQWIFVNLPPGASQTDYGSEVYRLVCQDCHGDRGQGLTAEWRATWAPSDQNCWQSKCHGPNHPPDGFVLPISPPVAGPGTLSQFPNAQSLHDYIQSSMPWYNPGSLTDKDSWGVTAYLLKMNGVDPGIQLGPDTAAHIRLGQ